jgi:deoxyribose-phosphate aldolase
VHDAIAAENAGLVATAIITDCFVPMAQAMAQVSGRPEFPCAVIAHPISNNADAVLRAKAAEAVRQCVAILLQP